MFYFISYILFKFRKKTLKCLFKHLSFTLTVMENHSLVISFFFPLKLASSSKWYVMGAWSGTTSRLPSSSTKEL